MILHVALIISVLLQFGAFYITIKLIPKTKFNSSWILISAGFLLMAIRRCIELVQLWTAPPNTDIFTLANWIAVFISLLMFIGAFYIRRIFQLQDQINKLRKDSEAKILNAVIKTEENERQIFAKELHDGLGPILSSIKMTVSAINNSIDHPKNTELMQKVDHATDEAILSIKELSNKLSPHILERFGLEKAIKTFIEGIHLPEQIQISLNLKLNNTRGDYNIELVIYRVIGELITNTIKHANASKIDISLLQYQQKLQLIYTDNGKAYSPLQDNTEGMGISNIKSRVRSLNGTVQMNNKQHKGCYVKIEIPEK